MIAKSDLDSGQGNGTARELQDLLDAIERESGTISIWCDSMEENPTYAEATVKIVVRLAAPSAAMRTRLLYLGG